MEVEALENWAEHCRCMSRHGNYYILALCKTLCIVAVETLQGACEWTTAQTPGVDVNEWSVLVLHKCFKWQAFKAAPFPHKLVLLTVHSFGMRGLGWYRERFSCSSAEKAIEALPFVAWIASREGRAQYCVDLSSWEDWPETRLVLWTPLYHEYTVLYIRVVTLGHS